MPARLRSVFRIFHPLDGFLPLLPFRPCFVPVTLLGFLPSELFPHSEAVAPLGARLPHAVIVAPRISCLPLPTNSRATRECGAAYQVRQTEALVSSTGFRASYLAGVRRRRTGLPRLVGSMLSWGSRLFRALRMPVLVVRLRTASSHELLRIDLASSRRMRLRRCAGSSESQSTRLRARGLSPSNLPS